MTVATTQTFNLTADEIIDAAWARAGGEKTTGYDARSARKNLQVLLLDLTVRGTNLWQVQYTTLNLTTAVANYTLTSDTIDILDVTVSDTSQATPTYLVVDRIGRDAYATIPDKTAAGRPFQFYVDRQRDAPVVYLYNVPDLTTYQLQYWYMRKPYDQKTFTDNVDLPTRWLPCMISGLAYYMARERRITLGRDWVKDLENDYEKDFAVAMTEDTDGSNLRIEPDLSRYF